MRLVLAGEEGPRSRALAAQAAEVGLGTSVDRLGHVPDDRLAALYRDAVAFLFPSRYEGFGLPPLEAMAAGCPVVSSPAGALAEVLDGAAVLENPTDPERWAHAVLALARDVSARAARVAAGRIRARSFTWQESARRTLEVYGDALAGRGRP
jgi:glycosyltransferase involved in cell wall biosynthesis